MKEPIFMPCEQRNVSEVGQFATQVRRRPTELIEDALVDFDKREELVSGFEVVEARSLHFEILPLIELLLDHLHLLAKEPRLLRVLIIEQHLVTERVELAVGALVFLHESIYASCSSY